MRFIDETKTKLILDRLERARKRHPYFADKLYESETAEHAPLKLLEARSYLKEQVHQNCSSVESVLLCELWEVFEALSRDDYESAIYECYDSVAVLLRLVDVLEGNLELGRHADDSTKGS